LAQARQRSRLHPGRGPGRHHQAPAPALDRSPGRDVRRGPKVHRTSSSPLIPLATKQPPRRAYGLARVGQEDDLSRTVILSLGGCPSRASPTRRGLPSPNRAVPGNADRHEM